jgi:hypothetical protein
MLPNFTSTAKITYPKARSIDAVVMSNTEQQQPAKNAKEGGDRSQEEAKKATEAFTKEQHNPLANGGPKIKPGITFAAEDKLPKLPIPDLESSLQKYIDALKPLQSSRERQETKQAVEDFKRNEGPELQEKLKKYATGKTSYIEQFCKLANGLNVRRTDTSNRVRLISQLRQPCRSQPQPLLPPRG